ncbi:MAG: hypothetical protein UY05_C0007G0005 [Candidatus Peregrinibacteria bacterium GW2011_GWA2_47_7]|nr:MAG: hypothetical protein UY05_C0007G0005 [Candidatus Peregrinibacteria bacterium GW2011_GWA2_47_7]
MKKILDSIRKSLDSKNYHSALVLSLIVPDICGKLEDSNKSSSKRYPEWFNKYLGKKYDNWLSGNDCYALRCSFLHEGSGNTENQRRAKDVLDYIVFTPEGGHCQRLSHCRFGDKRYDGKEILKLSTSRFCQDIIEATNKWLDDVKNNKIIQGNIAEMLDIHEGGFSIGRAILMN